MDTLAKANERIKQLEEENAKLRATQAPNAEASLAKAKAEVSAAEGQRQAAMTAKSRAEAEAVRAEARAEAAEAEAAEAEQRATAIEAEAKLSAGDVKAVARLAVLQDAIGKFVGADLDVASMKAPELLRTFRETVETRAAGRACAITASLGIDEPLPVSGEQPGTAPDGEPKSARQVWQQNLKE